MEEIIRAVGKVCGSEWAEICSRRGHQGKVLAMWAARNYGGVTLRGVGEAMGGMDYMAVSMRLKRYEGMLKRDAEARKMKTELMEMFDV